MFGIFKMRIFFASFIIISLFVLFLSFLRLDPDFSWHLQTGKLIWETQTIPRIDWYSFSMPDFPWVDHEWLSEIFIFIFYKQIGYAGLIILFYLFSAATLYLSVRKKKIEYYFLPLSLGFLALTPYTAVRVQIITWLFIAILVKIFFDENWQERKILYWAPLLFLFWANLHAGFFLGLLIFAFAVFWANKNRLKIIGIFFASVITTFINPYGYRIYEEIFRTTNDSFLRAHISEWQNFSANLHWPSLLYMALFMVLISLFYKKLSLEKFILAMITFIMALISTRHFPIFIIISLPLVADLIKETYEHLNLIRVKKIRVLLAGTVIFAFTMSLYFPSFPFVHEPISYPEEKMIDFLRERKEKRMFNDYGWGGYLILELPEKKVFIDGRMPSWRQNGTFALGDYVSLSEGRNIDAIIQKYNIEGFVLPLKERRVSFIFGNIFENYIPENLLKRLGLKNNGFNLIKYLNGQKEWQKIYQDDTGVIFEKIY